MCVICGDAPTWRYTFADGRRFTSSLPREYAEAQARAVEIVDRLKITKIEEHVSTIPGHWRSIEAAPGEDE